LRARCLEQPGYISGETLRENGNPSLLLVISTWYGLSDWRSWERQEERRAIVEEMRSHLSAQPRIRVFLEGLAASVSGT